MVNLSLAVKDFYDFFFFSEALQPTPIFTELSSPLLPRSYPLRMYCVQRIQLSKAQENGSF